MRAVRGYSFGHAVARHAVSRTSIGYFIGWTLRSDDVTAQHRMQRGYAALNTAAGATSSAAEPDPVSGGRSSRCSEIGWYSESASPGPVLKIEVYGWQS